MRYLCVRQLTAGGTTYHPGEIIPDGVILPERSKKLAGSGYVSVWSEETGLAQGNSKRIKGKAKRQVKKPFSSEEDLGKSGGKKGSGDKESKGTGA